MMSENKSHGWTPYLAPYATFLILIEICNRFPESFSAFSLGIKVAVPLGLFVYFYKKKSYPELVSKGFQLRWFLADIAFGLLVTVLWVAPYLLGWFSHPPGSEGFDPVSVAGPENILPVLAVRLLGFGLATAFIEELFVRSFLLRYLEVFDRRKDFRNVAMAHFAWRSFIGTVLYFTFSHQQWEWPVAAATCIAYNAWLYYRGNIGSTILAHAVTNISLFLFVVLASGRTLQGVVLNLWYFL